MAAERMLLLVVHGSSRADRDGAPGCAWLKPRMGNLRQASVREWLCMQIRTPAYATRHLQARVQGPQPRALANPPPQRVATRSVVNHAGLQPPVMIVTTDSSTCMC
eukprot:182705-Chlamydomonas_euryale.AAC.4